MNTVQTQAPLQALQVLAQERGTPLVVAGHGVLRRFYGEFRRELPDLEVGDLVHSENIGAYSSATSTRFNGFPPAKVVHINHRPESMLHGGPP